VECGLGGDGEFVRPRGQAAPLLESDDAPLDGIALLDPEPGHDRLKGRRVTGLTGGDVDTQRTSPTATHQRDTL
jgi:hypothetical protein